MAFILIKLFIQLAICKGIGLQKILRQFEVEAKPENCKKHLLASENRLL